MNESEQASQQYPKRDHNPIIKSGISFPISKYRYKPGYDKFNIQHEKPSPRSSWPKILTITSPFITQERRRSSFIHITHIVTYHHVHAVQILPSHMTPEHEPLLHPENKSPPSARLIPHVFVFFASGPAPSSSPGLFRSSSRQPCPFGTTGVWKFSGEGNALGSPDLPKPHSG